jgi:catechol 2,3-dioxygenase-like lactoylglutathione lyase family enzyme
MIQASGIDHIVLHVSDVQRSKRFYTELLGMTAYRENDTQVFPVLWRKALYGIFDRRPSDRQDYAARLPNLSLGRRRCRE